MENDPYANKNTSNLLKNAHNVYTSHKRTHTSNSHLDNGSKVNFHVGSSDNLPAAGLVVSKESTLEANSPSVSYTKNFYIERKQGKGDRN